MPTPRNQILRGFNPDPSILRVGEEYFIATSTFEFHPAVRIHHSTNLVDWTVRGHALELDLRGCTGVKDDGVPALTKWKGLRRLDLTGTGVSEPALARLRAALPQAEIHAAAGS